MSCWAAYRPWLPARRRAAIPARSNPRPRSVCAASSWFCRTSRGTTSRRTSRPIANRRSSAAANPRRARGRAAAGPVDRTTRSSVRHPSSPRKTHNSTRRAKNEAAKAAGSVRAGRAGRSSPIRPSARSPTELHEREDADREQEQLHRQPREGGGRSSRESECRCSRTVSAAWRGSRATSRIAAPSVAANRPSSEGRRVHPTGKSVPGSVGPFVCWRGSRGRGRAGARAGTPPPPPGSPARPAEQQRPAGEAAAVQHR